MSQALAVLVLVVRDRKYALPLAGVAEVMRPLSLRPLADVPAYVLGVATIRGRAVPVVDPGRLVDGQPGSPRRFVTVALLEPARLLPAGLAEAGP